MKKEDVKWYTLCVVLFVAMELLGCSTTNYKYQVYLVGKDGIVHLVTEDTLEEANSFIGRHKESHGSLRVVRVER